MTTADLDRPPPLNGLPGADAIKILIIDDDAVDRAIFRRHLDAADPGAFRYSEAESGKEGLKHLESFQPDCLLLDLNLPDMDGLQIVRQLYERRQFLPCAVVMLTGTGSERTAVEAMKLGVMDYLPKGPASAQALSRTVASAVQRFRLQQQVTEQQRALEDEKERYRTLAEAIPQLVWTADSEGRIHYANHRLWKFIGKDTDTACTLAGLVHADDRAGLSESWKQAVHSGRPFETELRLHREDGDTWRWHLMRTVPMRSTEDGPVRWFGTFTDIEDQRRAAEALRQRQKLDSIGLLAGGIAHDFNNLLVGIMGGASFALDTLDPGDSVYPMLEIVFRSSEKAAHLTRQLLAYSGKGQPFAEMVDISRVARETAELVRASIPSTVTLTIETDPGIPSIESNYSQMEQLVINLVMNAAEAIEDQRGTVRVRTAAESISDENSADNVLGYPLAAGQYAVIEVTDTGCGMDEQTQTHIFDPFFTTKFTGRGLGLAAVHGIVRSLGGGIQVRSRVGAGSCFRVVLPFKSAAGKRRILLIDDDVAASRAASSVLCGAGHEVLACGRDRGLEMFASNPGNINLVLLDGDASGWQESIARLRGLAPCVCVAILTAESANAGAEPGIDGIEKIAKPLTPASLHRIFNTTEIFNSSEGRDGAAA